MNSTEIGHRQTKYKKGGKAGVEGIAYQINLLIILLLKGLKLEEEWYLSTENKEAGKFDDLVFESAEGGVFVQAKHKENTEKKITLDGLLSTNTKNDDFSLPKYFFSYLEISEKFKTKSLIIATNIDLKIDANIEKYTIKQSLTEEDALYYEGSESASLYVFNDSILDQLKENIEKYYEENLQRKNISKEVICDVNITKFLEYLQFLTNYPVKGNLDAAVETVISETDLARNLDSKTAYNYMYRKIQDWFTQKKGVYLTKAYAKALICEIRTNSYCNALEKIDVHFDNYELPVKDPNKRVWHFVSQKDHIVDLMKLYRTLRKRNDKEFLLIIPEHDENTINLMIEAFELPSYVYLIIACSENSHDFVTEEDCDKLSNVLNSHDYKKLVILSEEDNELAEYFREMNLYQAVQEEVAFSDLDEESQKKLIKGKNVVFQGKDTSLAELLTLSGTEWNELIDSEMLIKLFRSEKIMVGSKVEALSENIKQYYINRTFNSTTENFPEKRLCDLDKIDKITLVSDSSGMGKSTVFTRLANALKEKYSNLWVTKVDINSYTKILSEFREAKVDFISITQLLNSQEETRLKTTFEKKLFPIQIECC
ncbi:hypothetical protein NQ318_000073 [Aromia moschata]|uniref:Uncharacterized protein n=1 Tax=Aromia moschata TaxID=1265417 RepID=A0AAV8YCB7_9CUCU|nr:hypothetical protein NQ318_000073 [Aromia moschata]